MEIFDVIDENGNPTGETVERKRAHAEGIPHRTAHIWIIRDKDGKYQALLQKRAQNKDSFPGCFDTSSAGHIQAGDEPKESALREPSEELGIHAEDEDLEPAGKFIIDYQTEFYGKPFIDKEIAFVFLYKKEVDVNQLVFQDGEVEGAAWFDLDVIHRACVEDDPVFCVPDEGIELVMNFLGVPA
ncbi:MAG: NUDIX domain-containing protein [Clostridiales bacterium]|nr:NUDIX domain-containing protein [Candidatus Blautia equi]